MEIIVVPKNLREKLGEDGTDSLVELFNKSNDRTRIEVSALCEDKFERRLAEELSKIRVDMAVNNSKMLRWMFAFWATQFLATIGILIGVLFR